MKNERLLTILIIIALLSCNNIDPKSMELTIESEELANQENWEQMFELNDKAIQIDNNNNRAFSNRAMARFKLKQDSLLIFEDINKALELKPNYSIAKMNKIVILFELNDWEQVVDLGSEYLKTNETQHIYSLVGESYNKIKNWNLSEEYLSKAIELDSSDSGAFKERGIANRKLKLFDKSLNDLTTAIELEPSFNQAFNSRAITWEKLGEFEKAFVDYSKAISIDSTGSSYWYNRGTLFFQLKEFEKGCYDIERAVELKHPDAEKEMAKYCK